MVERERDLQKTTKFRKRPPLRRGRVSPRLSLAGDIPKPPYLGSNELPEITSEHQIHESEGIVKMRAAYELGAHVLENAGCSQFSHACHAGRIIFWKANFYPSIHRKKSTNFFNCHGTVRAFAVFTSALCVEPITQEALRVMGSCSLSSLLYEPVLD
ncbi:METHIONINE AMINOPEPTIDASE [Salix koriyanagi]|uniref:METHIONINE AMINOPEPTIDASE n=1 Tax=Salix koriyanagi TaxID=2511006 RepID=A0A9Q1AI51_9ROSI|nr:METHIONINE AMINOPEPTIDASE [Salix koriyanagi]